MNSTLKKLSLAALVAAAACGIDDRSPTGVPVTGVVARMTDECQPRVTFTMPNDPGMTVYATNITVDHCSYIMAPPEGEVAEGKYCPLVLRPHLPIGLLAEYRIDSVRGPNAALRDSLNRNINHIVRIEEYPKFKEGITGVTYDLNGVQEGTWLINAELFTPTAPNNILNSNATQTIVGNPGGNWDEGFDRFISRGRVVVAVASPSATEGEFLYEGFSNQSRMWLKPQAGVKERTFEVEMIGHNHATASLSAGGRQHYVLGKDHKLYGPFSAGENVTSQNMTSRPFTYSLLKYVK